MAPNTFEAGSFQIPLH